MITFSIIFISCRELDSIAGIYIAAQNIRVIILLAVIYYAGKLDTLFEYMHSIINVIVFFSFALFCSVLCFSIAGVKIEER